MQTPQLVGESTFCPMPYPNEDSCPYQEYQINYHYAGECKAPKAIVVFIHGLYSYGGNSGYLATKITEAIPDVNFYSFDFLNFGKSTGDCRGYIHSFDWLVEQG
jgi:alpha-beta hydrolase superfamily lysophospholipase